MTTTTEWLTRLQCREKIHIAYKNREKLLRYSLNVLVTWVANVLGDTVIYKAVI